MKETLRFAIIGCGLVSENYIDALDNVEGAKLVAVSDNNASRLAKLSQAQGVDGYADYHQLLCRTDIDVVLVLTASGSHAEIGIDAANAGKHVIVEKPIDVTLEAAQNLVDCCRENNVILGSIFQKRFEPAVIALKEAVHTGQLGRINSCCCHTKWYRDQDYYDCAPWRGTLKLDGGGALINQGIHYIDLMLQVMGAAEEVYGYVRTLAHERIEGEDVAVAVIKFHSGAIGMIESTTSAYPGFYTRLDVHGNEGTIMLENDLIKSWELKSKSTCDKSLMSTGIEVRHRLQMKDIINSIRNGYTPEVSGEEAIKALKVVLAIYESNRTGLPVKLTDG